MRPLLLSCLAVLLLAACGRTRRTAVPVAAAGRIVTIDDRTLEAGGSDTVRFGRMHEGETAVLSLRLHNTTQRPLLLTSYRRTCGCIELTYDDQPVMPDAMLPLTLRFDTRGEWGWQLKLVTLRLSGAEAPFRLYVEADVE